MKHRTMWGYMPMVTQDNRLYDLDGTQVNLGRTRWRKSGFLVTSNIDHAQFLPLPRGYKYIPNCIVRCDVWGDVFYPIAGQRWSRCKPLEILPIPPIESLNVWWNRNIACSVAH